jgi:aminocarboxymuconate-semialdehyde decarboxylase
MIIDWHTHVYPPEEQEQPFWKGRCPMNIENVLKMMDETGIDVTVISNPYHELAHCKPDEQLRRVRRQNEYVAELRDTYPDRILGFATGVPCGGDAFVRETERALTELDLKGVIAMSSIKGEYPDDPPADPFFALLAERDAPVMIHPPAVAFGEERLREYRLASSVGRPADNCLALSRLIVKGIFERYPTLKLVGSHLGGGICEIIGRMDYAYELQEDAYFLGSYEPMLITRAPSEYLKMIYLDSTSYHAPAVRCAVETVGADHVLFGTDAPPLTVLKPRGLAIIQELGLAPGDKEKILHLNAAKLLKID